MLKFLRGLFRGGKKHPKSKQLSIKDVEKIHEGLITENRELRDSLKNYKTGAFILGAGGAGYGAKKGYDYYNEQYNNNQGQYNSNQEQYKTRRKNMIQMY